MGDAGRSPDATTLTAFVIATTLGGGNFIAVRFSNAELAPFWGAALRFAIAGALFVVIALGLRATWPRGRQLLLTVVYGALGFALFYALMYWALVRATAGVATVVLATVPLATLLLAAAQRLEPLRVRGVVGAVAAMLGIGALVIGPQSLDIPGSALVAMLGAIVCVGQGIIVSKRVANANPAVTNAVGMITGVAILIPLSLIAGETWALPRMPATVAALGYLVTLGSVGLFALILLVVRRWTVSATSYMFVLFPVVTLALGAWIADEPVTPQAVIGAVVVMVGVWFGALSPKARAVAPPSEAPLPPPAAPARAGTR